jgi:hypothetical protein
MNSVAKTRCLLIGLLSVLLGQVAHSAEFGAARAAAVKAAYLRYIAEYTSWPEAADATQPIVIGLLGSDPNGVAALLRTRAESAEGLRAQGRPLKLIDLELTTARGDDALAMTRLMQCDLLFLSEDGEHHWQQVQDVIGTRAIVTVGEVSGFAARRGMIEFVIDRDAGRVRMHINIDAVKRAELNLSARLLGLKEGVIIIRESGEIG